MQDYKEVFVETIYFVKVRDMFVKNYERGMSFGLTFNESEAQMFEHQITKSVNDGEAEVINIANSEAEALAREVANDISEILGGNGNVRVGKKIVTSSTDIKYIDDIDAVEPEPPMEEEPVEEAPTENPVEPEPTDEESTDNGGLTGEPPYYEGDTI